MGWYGDYNNIEEVIEEMTLTCSRNFKVVKTKKVSNRGALFLLDELTYEYFIEYFIFSKKDGMYKPLHWLNGMDFIPDPWMKKISFSDEYEATMYNIYLMEKDKKKENKKIMEEILRKGQKYKIRGKVCEYEFKQKRSYIFSFGQHKAYIRFINLRLNEIEEIE